MRPLHEIIYIYIVGTVGHKFGKFVPLALQEANELNFIEMAQLAHLDHPCLMYPTAKSGTKTLTEDCENIL